MSDHAIQQCAASPVVLENHLKIAAVNDTLKQLPQLEIVIRHYFAQGVYAREGVIPKGAMFAGRVHLQSQINIISKGDISVLTEQGLIRMIAPCTLVSPPGAQRAAYAHEDTVWTTILGTDETDPETIFNTLTRASYEDFLLVTQAGEPPCTSRQ